MAMVVFQMNPNELELSIRKAVEEVLKSQPTQTQDELMSRIKTASYLGVSLPTLNTYEKTGELVPIRYGNRVFYRKSDLLKK